MRRPYRARGGTGDAIGRLVAEFKKLGITASGDVAKAFNTLFVQGNLGSFTLGNMSSEGEKLVSSFVRLGYSGPSAVKQMGALAQVARSVTGSAPEATSAVEGFLRAFTDAKKIEKIEKELGVQVRLDDGSYREVSEIAMDLVAAVGGDIVQLSDIFDETGLRVIGGLTSKAGQNLYRQALDVKPTGNEVAGASARLAKTTEAQAQDIRTSFEAKLTKHFTGPLRGAATAIAGFQGELLAATGAGFLLTGAFKAAKGGIGLISAFRGSRGAEAAGGAAEAVGEVELGGDPREKGAQRGQKGRIGPKLDTMRVNTLFAKKMVGGKGKGRGGAVVAGKGDPDSGARAGGRRPGLGAAFGRGREGGRRPGLGAAFGRGREGGRRPGLGAAFGRGREGGQGAVVGAVIGGLGLVESIVSGNTENLAEDVAGLVGAIAGGAIGATAGSVAGPVGAVAGGTVGAMAGDAFAREMFDEFAGIADRFESAVPASGVHPLNARRQALLQGPGPIGGAARVNLEPAPSVGLPVRTRGNFGNVQVKNNIRVSVTSNASDPKQVAMEVADEIERRQGEQRVRLDDNISADEPAEIIY